jgi:hypothetical protein
MVDLRLLEFTMLINLSRLKRMCLPEFSFCPNSRTFSSGAAGQMIADLPISSTDRTNVGPEAGSPLESFEDIMRLGSAFWGSRVLFSAVELGVFTELALNQLDGEQLSVRLGVHPRSARDFFDALVALGMLERTNGVYANCPIAEQFLDRAKPGYRGGVLEMQNARLWGFWADLTEGLRTGLPQNEAKTGGDLFDTIYSDPDSLREFQKAMTGLSMGAIETLARKFSWQDYQTVSDIGSSEGALLVAVARCHPHLTGLGFDLPQVAPRFEEYVADSGLSGTLSFVVGDFFTDELPPADVLVFGHVLHDWDLETRRMLLSKAYTALPTGGAVVILEALIDDERRTNSMALLESLNMLIETRGGSGFTGADCQAWLSDAGFQDARVDYLAGRDGMVVGFKK